MVSALQLRKMSFLFEATKVVVNGVRIQIGSVLPPSLQMMGKSSFGLQGRGRCDSPAAPALSPPVSHSCDVTGDALGPQGTGELQTWAEGSSRAL